MPRASLVLSVVCWPSKDAVVGPAPGRAGCEAAGWLVGATGWLVGSGGVFVVCLPFCACFPLSLGTGGLLLGEKTCHRTRIATQATTVSSILLLLSLIERSPPDLRAGRSRPCRTAGSGRGARWS